MSSSSEGHKKCVQKQNKSSSGKLRQLIAIDDIFEYIFLGIFN